MSLCSKLPASEICPPSVACADIFLPSEEDLEHAANTPDVPVELLGSQLQRITGRDKTLVSDIQINSEQLEDRGTHSSKWSCCTELTELNERLKVVEIKLHSLESLPERVDFLRSMYRKDLVALVDELGNALNVSTPQESIVSDSNPASCRDSVASLSALGCEVKQTTVVLQRHSPARDRGTRTYSLREIRNRVGSPYTSKVSTKVNRCLKRLA